MIDYDTVVFLLNPPIFYGSSSMQTLKTLFTAGAMSSILLIASSSESQPSDFKNGHPAHVDRSGPYQARDFSHLLDITGLSEKTLTNHFKLYQGYVTNTNLLFTTLQ